MSLDENHLMVQRTPNTSIEGQKSVQDKQSLPQASRYASFSDKSTGKTVNGIELGMDGGGERGAHPEEKKAGPKMLEGIPPPAGSFFLGSQSRTRDTHRRTVFTKLQKTHDITTIYIMNVFSLTCA